MLDLAYHDLAARQHGLVTRAQLLQLGSRRQIERLVSTKRLVAMRRGVLRVVGSPESWEQCLMGACLAGGDSARASMRAAAALWGFDGFGRDVLEITIDPVRRARLDGVIVHESSVNPAFHRTTRLGIPTTSVARTLVDLSARLPRWRIDWLLDDALRRNLTTMSAYRHVAGDLAARGRRRSTITAAVLESRSATGDGAESDGERRVASALVAAGLPRPVAQHRVRLGSRNVRIDLAYPSHMIAIEYDGWAFHRGHSSFTRDRARDVELEVRGWTVVRFTSESSDEFIVTTLRRLRDRRSAG